MSLDSDTTLRPEPGPKAAGGSSVRGGFCLRLIATTAVMLLMYIFLNSLSPKALAYPLKAKQIDWALVAMNHLGELEEAQCWVELIWRESRFNPLARNGSHYGLAQMRNAKVAGLNPRKQVRWHLRYLDHRYAGANGRGSACLALDHLNRKGWH